MYTSDTYAIAVFIIIIVVSIIMFILILYYSYHPSNTTTSTSTTTTNNNLNSSLENIKNNIITDGKTFESDITNTLDNFNHPDLIILNRENKKKLNSMNTKHNLKTPFELLKEIENADILYNNPYKSTKHEYYDDHDCKKTNSITIDTNYVLPNDLENDSFIKLTESNIELDDISSQNTFLSSI